VKRYKNINDPQRSFVAPFVDKHSRKNEFFSQINKHVDFEPIATKLKEIYTKGLTERGAKAYSPILLFKMHLISQWYQISDTQTEAMVYDSISALRFCGLNLEENVPGHSTLSRFKKELLDRGSLTDLTDVIQMQLANQNLRINPGKSRVDAKLVAKPIK
jgi:IS5 family transposase